MRRGMSTLAKDKAKTNGNSSVEKASTIVSKLPYMISGKRFQDTVLKSQLQRISPASSSDLSSRHNQNNKNPPVNTLDSRPKTPVIVVGYPDGFPRGLHIFGNKAKHPTLLISSISSSKNKENITDSDTKQISGSKENNELTSPTTSKPTTVLLTSVSADSSNKIQSKDPPEQKSKEDKKAKTGLHQPIAPWREMGGFQTLADRRKQTYQNFKMMSPDPPKTPTQTSSRQTAKTVVIKLHKNATENIDTNSSMSVYSKKWSSREVAFQNSSSVATSASGKVKMKHGSGAEKSTTGLALNLRSQARDSNSNTAKLRKTPSRVTTKSRSKKSASHYNSTSAVLTPKKSLTAVTVANVTATNPAATFPNHHIGGQPVTGNVQNHGNRWSSIIQTNAIPLPPSKRLEQARLMNHIIHGYSSSNATSRNDAIRDRFVSSNYNTGQRLSGVSGKQNQQHLSLSAPSSGTKPKILKPPLLPPVHIPGPKKENIYIGRYDGSDESDSETDPPKQILNSPSNQS